ncbi:restriction endonuclease subunit S [Insolitispirillum peregrinum]|uniref:Type I restriction enzyme, S subunit n=1 Tax=Insolitispirillum peregrinum TaxID=80876 RepID=A0A1N7P579_9PROT|nr:restriction endonuclease subunit S [Insolitispirillum peregrinum]SIT05763.1 type I restriction enzyme, S subunit [Insolitispirillum peregrinum]
MTCLRPLACAADFINGYAFKPSDWCDVGRPIIRIQNLTDGSKKFNRTLLEIPSKYIVKRGDLLVSWSATLGVFQWGGEDGLVNQHIFKVVPKSGVDLNYLRYAIDSSLHQMERYTHGSTMKHINRQEFLETLVWLPPLDEQRRIAAILDKADAIRRKRQQALALADDFLRSAFLEMFGDPVTNPKGWELDTLGNHLDYLTSGSRGWATYYSDDGSDTFIRIGNVGHNQLLLDDIQMIHAPDNAEARRTKVKAGDVLLSITADLGRTAVIPADFGSAYINQHLAIIRPRGFESLFLSQFLASRGGQTQFQQLDRSGVKSGLNFDDIRSLKIPLVPMSQQRRFTDLWRRVKSASDNFSLSGRTADTLFASLSQRAFRGEL